MRTVNRFSVKILLVY